MAAALARLRHRSVKQVWVQFCPFENNVESTRTFLQAVSSEKVRCTNLNCSVIAEVRHDGSEPCVDVLFCSVIADVRHDGSEPCVDVLFGGFRWESGGSRAPVARPRPWPRSPGA